MSNFFEQLKQRHAVRLAIAFVLIAVAFPVTAGTDPVPPAPEVSPSRVSLAVLPFVNMSSDPGAESFANGITEKLLDQLAKDRGLLVVDRALSFAYKGQNKGIEEIGRELGVANIVEGAVRKAGNRVRVTVQLISAGDGFHLWSQTFDRRLEDVPAILEEIAEAVAEAIKAAQ